MTNSSSSSFVLEIGIQLKDGKEICFVGNGGSGETGRVDYFDADAVVKVSPKELALAFTVEDMIKLLENGVVDDCYGTEYKIFEKSNPVESDVDGEEYDAYEFIEEIRENLNSMRDVSSITITGNEYNYIDYERSFTYDKETGKYYGTIEGEPIFCDGSNGGDLRFSIVGCEVEKIGNED